MLKKRNNTRKENALETREKIYTTADRLFRDNGFEEVTVDTIVKIAGVSKGTFYIYFESKDALITELIANNVNKIDLDYDSYVKSFPIGTPATDILVSLVEKIAHVITETIGYDVMKIIYEVQLTRTVNTSALLNYNRAIYSLFKEVIALGVEQDEFAKSLTPETVSKHFILALRGLTYEWCVRYPDFDLKTQFLEHFRILLGGISMPHSYKWRCPEK